MERLTIPDKKVEGGWERAVIDPQEVKKYAMTIYWALKKYEDTGLTPDEINALRERDIKSEEDITKFYYCETGKLLQNFLQRAGGQGERRKRDEKSVSGTLLDKQKNPGKHLG